MSHQHEPHDERGAAPVLFFICSDHRHNRSADVAIIEIGIDRLARLAGIIETGEQVEFDVIQVPGPARGLGQDDQEGERKLLTWYADLLLELHGGELVIMSYHWQCGREGDLGTDRDHLQLNMLRAIRFLQECFPNHAFAGIGIHIEGGRTVSLRTYSPEKIGQMLDARKQIQTSAVTSGASTDPGSDTGKGVWMC